ncbi:hypothetical protein [Streptomyces daliensis]|uniref:Uncharacterized protein n=1 Tax=Streptomyces daliensis TaxID=299421 RepID=A0A8T4II80_9ACTN|nr:hypothetical protein [Streptomyces daliensis]
MAMRKATMKEQVSAAIAEAAPGDRALVTVTCLTGPTPWLTGALGLIGQLMVKYYFVTLTDQAVVLHRMHRFSQRPQEVSYVIPRDQAPATVSQVGLNPLWSSFHMALPGTTNPIRLNVHRMWRGELEQFLSAIGAAPQQQGYAPQAAPQQQGYAPQAAPQAPPQYGGHPQPDPRHLLQGQGQGQAQYGNPAPQQQGQGQPAPYGYAQTPPQQGNGNPYGG